LTLENFKLKTCRIKRIVTRERSIYFALTAQFQIDRVLNLICPYMSYFFVQNEYWAHHKNTRASWTWKFGIGRIHSR